MKPVDQTIFYDPTAASVGRANCLQACVASLLEMPLEAVPNFNEAEHWFMAYMDFLASQGYELLSNRYFPDGPFPENLGPGVGGLFIGAGPSPRGISHAVIIDATGRIVHDPHPSRAGVCRLHEVDVIERRLERERKTN